MSSGYPAKPYLASQSASKLTVPIDLFIWPTLADEDRGGGSGVREGYNFVHWQTNVMSFQAVSDLNAQELTDFAAKWR